MNPPRDFLEDRLFFRVLIPLSLSASEAQGLLSNAPCGPRMEDFNMVDSRIWVSPIRNCVLQLAIPFLPIVYERSTWLRSGRFSLVS